jgi:autotransporter-associated beta strand protein
MPGLRRKFRFRSGIAEFLVSARLVVILGAASMTSVSATDFAVTTVNDSGAGSMREAISQAQSGDRIVFEPILDGQTLINGGPIVLTVPVTFADSTKISLFDSHPFTLIPAQTVQTTVGKNVTTVTTQIPLTVNWGGTLTLNGILSNPLTGTGSLAKGGVGTLVLNNANTFTGGTTLSAGTLTLGNSQSLGFGGLAVTLPANATTGTATLDFNRSINFANTISLASGTTLSINSAKGTTNQLSGIISNAVTTGGGTSTAGVLNTTGNGTLILSAANTFSGGVHVIDDTTISILNNAALGSGTLTTSGALDLKLADGIIVGNKVTLGNSFIANVSSGTAQLTGAIGDASTPSTHPFTKTGAGTLILSGVNTYKIGTVVSEGTLQGNATSLVGHITNNSSLIFNQTANGSFGGTIDGTGTMTKTGNGNLIFTGTSTLPTTLNITAGGFQVASTGNISSPVNISSSSATLSGNGSIGTLTNSGTVLPGANNIGTLTINGDYNQTSRGALQIEVDSKGNSPGVNNDLLDVKGKAKLDGILKVLTLDPTYTPGTRYTILTATGGVTGPFVQASTNNYQYGAEVIYGPNDVAFQLKPTTSLQAAAITSNQSSVGSALDNIAISTSGTAFANGPLFSTINSLGIQTPDQQRQAMDQLSGAMFGNLESVGLQVGSQFQQLVTNSLVNNAFFLASGQMLFSSDTEARGQYPTDETTRGWMQGFGVGGNIRSDGNGPSVNYGQGGALFGIDGGRDDTGYVGLAAGSSYVEMHDSFGSKAQITSYQLGAYAMKHNEVIYNLSTMNYGYNSYFTNRDITIPGSQQLLHADFSGNQFGASTESGMKMSVGPVYFQPFVGLQYLYLCQQGFEETGGAAGLSANRTRANSLRANVGARLLVDPWTGWNGAVWTPFTHARFIAEMLDNDRIINANFTDAPSGGAFTTQGTRIGYNYGVVGEGLEIRVNDWWSLLGNAEVMFSDRMTITTGSIASVARW